MHLSNRHANNSNLIISIEKDSQLRKMLTASMTETQLQEVSSYLIDKYKCSENEAEEALHHIFRLRQQQYSQALTSRSAQSIQIPATTDNPAGRTVPIKDPEAQVTPPPPIPANPAIATGDLQIDASPASTPTEKAKDLSKALETGESRQQRLLDDIKAVKILLGKLALDMFAISEFPDDRAGKVVTKIISAMADECADMTADTVKNLASPLLGGS